MRPIDADALEELFRETIHDIATRTDMQGDFEHMIRASAMVVEMIKDAPTIDAAPAQGKKLKGISCCGDCGYYNWKKHKCNRCNSIESDARTRFYDDCPLPDVIPAV